MQIDANLAKKMQKIKCVIHVKFNFKEIFVNVAVVDRQVCISITRSRTQKLIS